MNHRVVSWSALALLLLGFASSTRAQVGAPLPMFQATPMMLSPRPAPTPLKSAPLPMTPAPLNSPASASLGIPSPLPAAPANNAPVENLRQFDPSQVQVTWSGRHWQLAAGPMVLKDFGTHEQEARQALRLVQELRLNQYGTVGSPTPVMEYWLADGRAPATLSAGLRPMHMDPGSFRVEQVHGAWCLRDNQRVWFNFGQNLEEARRGCALSRKYDFAQLGVLGQGSPDMLVFATGGTPDMPTLASARASGLGSQGRSLHVPTFPRAKSPPVLTARAQSPGKDGPTGEALASLSPAFSANLGPKAVQTTSSESEAPPPGFWHQPRVFGTGAQQAPPGGMARIAFDWRHVHVQLASSGWQLLAGSQVLANFGNSDQDARMALNAVRYYRFTEEYRLGGEKPYLTYFTATRQSPFGTLLGLQAVPVAPDKLEVRQAGHHYDLVEGDQVVLRLGEKQEEAKQLLEVIQKNKFDRIMQLGKQEGEGVALLVKSK